MSELNSCDVCGKPGRWAMVVTGCSEHKVALKLAVENCNSNQHLRAEIQAISNIIEVSESGFVTVDFANLKQRLRELSTVTESVKTPASNNSIVLEIALMLREVFGIVDSKGDYNLSSREIQDRLDTVVAQLQQ